MASNTNFCVHGTEMAGIINQPNTHQMEEPAEDTLNGFTPPTCRDSTTTGPVVVLALPCDQSYLSRRKKARDQRVEGSMRTWKGKRKELCATVPVDHDKLPFEKNKLLWEVAESLEAFRLMPHKPHFCPLESCTEIQREGKALSLMVLFDKITKKTLNLQREAPREDIENDLSLLKKLETHGFYVLKLRNALTSILLLKDQLEDIENLSKEYKRQLAEFDSNKCKSKEKRIKMQDEITKLMEEARLADLGEIKSYNDSASEQLAIRKHDDELTRISMEIKELVASPLY